jgi:lycopene cyclase domain-containing protein
MPEYTVAVVAAVVAVVALELGVTRSGILVRPAYWITVAIVLLFQVAVDGWLTKQTAPIVVYRSSATTGLRWPWDIPVEDFGFGFALVTLVLQLWVRQARA